MKLKKLLKNPETALGLVPAIFAFSQVIIIGYYWFIKGYAGNLTYTISRYVGLELWTSIFFAICNILISLLMFRCYKTVKPKLSTAWFVFGLVQILAFLGLSFFPLTSFVPGDAGATIRLVHEISSRTMFFAMFLMALERLRLAGIKDARIRRATLFFALYGLYYAIGYLVHFDFLWSTIFICETGYIYAFMAMLLITRPSKKLSS